MFNIAKNSLFILEGYVSPSPLLLMWCVKVQMSNCLWLICFAPSSLLITWCHLALVKIVLLCKIFRKKVVSKHYSDISKKRRKRNCSSIRFTKDEFSGNLE